jgi:hypothetical protein
VERHLDRLRRRPVRHHPHHAVDKSGGARRCQPRRGHSWERQFQRRGRHGRTVDAAAEEENVGHRAAAGSGREKGDADADEEERIPSGGASAGHADADAAGHHAHC